MVKHPPIPVIMYHSVGRVNKDWLWSHLTCPWELFESHLRWMKRLKMNTISLQDLYEYKRAGVSVPNKSVVLTFDDGYLDNWVFAFPLLKKYGFKGTIFINPEFVNPESIARKNLEDVWQKRIEIDKLEADGFLSWNEIGIMERSGVVDIQSHSMSHTWFFSGARIIDFHHPGNGKYPWLFWNACLERKSYYLNERQEHFVPYGTPIYENGRSLGIKRYFEDEKLNKFVADFASRQGGDFFSRKDWRNSLLSQADLCRNRNTVNERYESDHEQEDRYRYELIEAKKVIDSKLGKEVKFLCWPGGAKTEASVKVCFDSGYLSYTISCAKDNGKNIYPEDPSRIYRIGSPEIQHKGRMLYLGGVAFIVWFYAFRGNFMARIVKKIIRLSGILAIKLMLKKDIIVTR